MSEIKSFQYEAVQTVLCEATIRQAEHRQCVLCAVDLGRDVPELSVINCIVAFFNGLPFLHDSPIFTDFTD
jgi:hypothetical protein